MRTDREIVDQTNKLARQFYLAHGYEVEEGYRFDKAHHPQELSMWNLAKIAQLELTDTDSDEALINLEEES